MELCWHFPNYRCPRPGSWSYVGRSFNFAGANSGDGPFRLSRACRLQCRDFSISERDRGHLRSYVSFGLRLPRALANSKLRRFWWPGLTNGQRILFYSADEVPLTPGPQEEGVVSPRGGEEAPPRTSARRRPPLLMVAENEDIPQHHPHKRRDQQWPL